MTSLELTGVTSGGVPWDPGGLDPLPGGTIPDLPLPVSSIPFDTSIPDFPLTTPGQMGVTNPAPEGTFFPDAAGNIRAADGSIVIPADEVGAALGGPLTPLEMAPFATTTSPSDRQLRLGAAALENEVAAGAPPPPSPPPDPGLLDRIGKATGLDPSVVRGLLTLGLGAGGIGLAQLIAGGTSGGITIPQPPQTQGQQALADLFARNPAAAAALQEAILRSLQSGVTGADVLGQELNQALAANGVEEPVRSAIRNASLQELLAIQQGLPPRDPVTAALRTQLLSVTLTGATDPRLERESRQERDVLQNRMFTALGPQWEMTTPGIDAATKLSESEAIRNYEDYLNTVSNLAGPYQAGQAQSIKTSTGLSVLGLPDVPATVNALRGIASPSDIAGVDTTNRATLQGQAAQDRAALISAIQEQDARTGLGTSISDLVNRATRNAFSLAA